jgi:type IV pilus assembly protein PilE
MYKSYAQRGVTLMELLVVVAVIGILSAIAYPSYRNTIMKSNRTDGRRELLTIAGHLEKCYTRYMRYNDTVNCPIASQLNGSSYPAAMSTYYNFTGSAAATTFAVTATAKAGQLQDTDCRTLSLDQTGSKTATKSDASANNIPCWK